MLLRRSLRRVVSTGIADLLIRQHRLEHMVIAPVEQYEDPRLHPTSLKLKELVDVGNMEEQMDVDYIEELVLLVNELDLKGVREGSNFCKNPRTKCESSGDTFERR